MQFLAMIEGCSALHCCAVLSATCDLTHHHLLIKRIIIIMKDLVKIKIQALNQIWTEKRGSVPLCRAMQEPCQFVMFPFRMLSLPSL